MHSPMLTMPIQKGRNVFVVSRVYIREMRQLYSAAVPIALVCGALACASANAADGPTFEAASIKPAAPPLTFGGDRVMFRFGRRGGPGTADPGRITWNNASLMDILIEAWDVKRFQVIGPDWLGTERFDIVAKVPAGATKEQVRVMWQDLLAERWNLSLHHGSKVFEVDELVTAKGGPKLKTTDLDPSAPEAQPPDAPPAGPPKLDKNGIPELNAPGLFMMQTIGPNGLNARMIGKAQTMAQLANRLGDQLNRAVVDKTGLTGKYDFVVEFTPDPGSFLGGPGRGPGGPLPEAPRDGPQIPGANDPSGLTLIGALQQQLGLRLHSTKAPLDILVIDRANKAPTEN